MAIPECRMRCTRCHRRIGAATITIGGMSFGPVCARIMGADLRKARAPAAAVLQDGQMPLWVVL